MQKAKLFFYIIFFLYGRFGYAQQIINGNNARQMVPGAELIRTSRYSQIPDYIRFEKGNEISYADFDTWLHKQYKLSNDIGFKLLTKDTDGLGFIHYRYQQTFKGLPVEGTMYIIHVKNEKVVSMNGMIFNALPSFDNPSLSEQTALANALNYMNGSFYRWQSQGEEQQLQKISNNPNATWYPKGELMLAPNGDNYHSENYKLAYRFDIYCERPLKRQYVFVDAQNGQVINAVDRIDNTTVLGTAQTAYSGTRKINTDSVSKNIFNLSETKRGLGVVTYNLNQGTDYGTAVNFTNATDTWHQVDAALDQYATDAHWGAERTFDFYDSTYHRYSLDNAGLELISYVHYDVDYVNAFWDGTEMNYGDGDPSQGYTPLTTIDICGHEMTHGVTQFTCNLEYEDESGALDESFSDCAGMAIENFSRGSTDWLIGSQIGTPFRSMRFPKDYGQPNTYLGVNWYTGGNDDGGVHTNSGVQNFWFYILSQGDTGTNDNSDAYSMKGIGIKKAHAITFRNQTVYLFPTAQYADARFYAIQSAIDLYGACSNEEITTTNAWYAVGVGGQFVDTVISKFDAGITSFCSIPASVSFKNQSTNGQSYSWNFGDNSNADTLINPIHQYTKAGTYTVTLTTDGGKCGNATIVQKNLISIALPSAPKSNNDSICPNQTATLTATASGSVEWYDALTGGNLLFTGPSYITPPLTTTTTYYPENVVSNSQEVGPTDNTFSSGGYFQYNYHYEIFDCYAPTTLQSVVIYAQSSGTYIIELLADSSFTTLDSVIVNAVGGKQTITLNFALPVEHNLLLGLGSTSDGGLYRNNGGANYPYTIQNVVSITGSDVGSSYYYFFYEWQVDSTCVSTRTPVTVVVSPLSVGFTYSPTGLKLSFTNTSSGATSYSWNFGDGKTDTSSNPSHTYSTSGTYNVTLVASNGTCNDTTIETIKVGLSGIVAVPSENSISVFPNPFSSNVEVKIEATTSGLYQLSLVNILGQVVTSNSLNLKVGENDWDFNFSSMPVGMYFLQLQSGNNVCVKKIIKQE